MRRFTKGGKWLDASLHIQGDSSQVSTIVFSGPVLTLITMCYAVRGVQETSLSLFYEETVPFNFG